MIILIVRGGSEGSGRGKNLPKLKELKMKSLDLKPGLPAAQLGWPSAWISARWEELLSAVQSAAMAESWLSWAVTHMHVRSPQVLLHSWEELAHFRAPFS